MERSDRGANGREKRREILPQSPFCGKRPCRTEVMSRVLWRRLETMSFPLAPLFVPGGASWGRRAPALGGAYGTAGRAEQQYCRIADAVPGQKEAGCACPPQTPLRTFGGPAFYGRACVGLGVRLADLVVCHPSSLLLLAGCPSACGSRSIRPTSLFYARGGGPAGPPPLAKQKFCWGVRGGALQKAPPRNKGHMAWN